MAITYQLNNSANWSQVWSGSFNSTPVPGASDRFYPIPEVICPFSIESHVVAVYCQSSTASPSWRLGGLMNYRIQTGILSGNSPDTYPIEKKRIWLNRITLFTLPELTPEFSLSFDIPYWFQQISISVYQYTGPIVDTLETKIDAVQADLNALITEYHQNNPE